MEQLQNDKNNKKIMTQWKHDKTIIMEKLQNDEKP